MSSLSVILNISSVSSINFMYHTLPVSSPFAPTGIPITPTSEEQCSFSVPFSAVRVSSRGCWLPFREKREPAEQFYQRLFEELPGKQLTSCWTNLSISPVLYMFLPQLLLLFLLQHYFYYCHYGIVTNTQIFHNKTLAVKSYLSIIKQQRNLAWWNLRRADEFYVVTLKRTHTFWTPYESYNILQNLIQCTVNTHLLKRKKYWRRNSEMIRILG